MLDLGVKHAVLVAKHDCGFTLWPTAAKEPDGRPYNFSIIQSRYKGGKGDVVAEFVASMQRAGLEHGFYCSQGLKQNGYAREKRWTTAQYSPVIRTFLTELWSEKKYTGATGLLRELWMDGGIELTDQSWVKQAVAQWQPNASVFNGCCLFNGSLPPATDGSRDAEIAANCVTKNPISWIGTEAGHAPEDTWSSGLQWGAGSSSSPTASFRESDTVLQKTQWFFTGEDVRTLPDLIGSYETTAGHNSLFMIDFAPQPNGLLHPLHVATYKALGDWIRECYYSEGGRVANTSAAQMLWLQADSSSRSTGNILRLELSEPSFVNRVVLQEDLTHGQAVRAWEVEGQLANASKAAGAPWVLLASGQSIGNKRIAVLSHATALLALRLRVVRAAAEVVSMKNFAAHSCQVPMKNDDAAGARPNLVHVVVDDLGFHDVGYKDPEIISPNLDQLRAEGVELGRFYSAKWCAPARSSMQSGRYPWRSGYYTVPSSDAVSLAFPLLPEVLVRAGYRAHAVGKWHLGFKVRDYSPTFRGFHSFVGYYNSMEDYFTHHGPTPTGVCSGTDLSNSSVASGIRAAPRSLNGTYSSEIYSARAAEIFAEHARDHANSPLYLYLPFQSVHMPNEAPADMIAKQPPMKNSARRTYLGMISAMDAALGDTMASMKAHGLWANAVLLLNGDNGGPVWCSGMKDCPSVSNDQYGPVSNYPLRSGKWTNWDGGFRVASAATCFRSLLTVSNQQLAACRTLSSARRCFQRHAATRPGSASVTWPISSPLSPASRGSPPPRPRPRRTRSICGGISSAAGRPHAPRSRT